jgi:hypothetical protein
VSDPDFRFGSFGSRNLIDPDPRFDHTGFKMLFQNGRLFGPRRDIPFNPTFRFKSELKPPLQEMV